MQQAIGYIRVSTQGQAEDGISLDAQRAKIAAWCDLNGFELAGIYADEGISGTKTDRPGLLAAMAEVKKGTVLVVYSLSRLTRSTKHTLELSERLEKIGADLVSITEKIDTTSAAGRMVFKMLAVLAEFERDQVSERTKAALAHKKSQGGRVGSIPYGKRLSEDGISLVDDAEEMEIIRLVSMLRAGGMSYPKIAGELTSRGLSPRGKAWYPQTIANIAGAA